MKRSLVCDEMALISEVLPDPLSPDSRISRGDWECMCSFHRIRISCRPTISLARFLSMGLESKGLPLRVGMSNDETLLTTIDEQAYLGFLIFTHNYGSNSLN